MHGSGRSSRARWLLYNLCDWPMLESAQRLSSVQQRQLSRLHVQCLPDTGISSLGSGYARSFYHYIIGSPREYLCCDTQGNDIIGAAIMSLDPQRLLRRLWWRTPLTLHLVAGVPSLRRWRAVKALWPRAPARDNAAPPQPEMIYLFTAVGSRRRGVASGLLERQEARLVSLGHYSYVVRTPDMPNSPATRFYASQHLSSYACAHGIRYWRKLIE